MHVITPRLAAFRAYTAGGARGTVDNVDTSHLFQEMTGGFMAGESRQQIEHFEPYGFTSGIIPRNKDGVAEALMSFAGGNRGFPIAGVIGDRRYRPLGLKPGENAQYDQMGQMTLLRGSGSYVVSNDNPDPTQSGQSGQQQPERMASLRHVNKKPQKRPTTSATGDALKQQQQDAQNYKHEGETVNTEVRSDAKYVRVFDGDGEVARYDKAGKSWTFSASNSHSTNSGSIAENGQTYLGGAIGSGVKVSKFMTVDTGGFADIVKLAQNVWAT